MLLWFNCWDPPCGCLFSSEGASSKCGHMGPERMGVEAQRGHVGIVSLALKSLLGPTADWFKVRPLVIWLQTPELLWKWWKQNNLIGSWAPATIKCAAFCFWMEQLWACFMKWFDFMSVPSISSLVMNWNNAKKIPPSQSLQALVQVSI